MDYKEKYEQAVEKIRNLFDEGEKKGYTIMTYRKNFKEIFPELAESEDEKVKKALIEMVHDTTGDELWVDYNVHKEDILAWLEKQGEQKPVEWSDEDERSRRCLILELERLGANTRTDSTSPNYSFSEEINWLKSLRPQNTKM